MKSLLNFTVLFLTMLIINSCGKGKEELKNSEEISDNNNNGEVPNYRYESEFLESKSHSLHLVFQDAFGNDLVKEFINYYGNDIITFSDWIIGEMVTVEKKNYNINVRGDSYIAKIECALVFVFEGERIIRNPWRNIPTETYQPDSRYLETGFVIWGASNTSYNLFLSAQSSPLVEKIIFRLTCPYIFGDNEAHDIVTWWELLDFVYNEVVYSRPSCYHIELDGKEFPVKESIATIVLDK